MVDYYPTVVFAFAKEINNGDNESKELLNGPFHHDTLFQGIIMGPQALLIFGTTKISTFLTNTSSRFALVVLGGVLGPLHLARHT